MPEHHPGQLGGTMRLGKRRTLFKSDQSLLSKSTTAQQLQRWATVSPQYTWVKKWGLLCPFLWWGAGSPSNTMWPGPRPTCVPSGILIHPVICRPQTVAENWGLCHLFWEGAGFPYNTMSPWPRPTSVPSGIFIHQAV